VTCALAAMGSVRRDHLALIPIVETCFRDTKLGAGVRPRRGERLDVGGR
jgi:hypothetical protein